MLEIKEFSNLMAQFDKTSSRTELTEMLVGFFKGVSEVEAAESSYLVLGSLAPAFAGVEFAMSEKTMQSVLQQMLPEEFDVKTHRDQSGDVGETFMDLYIEFGLGSSGSIPLSTVYEDLWKIAQIEGVGSTAAKIAQTVHLFEHLSPVDAKYLSRVIVGKMRTGVSDKTILDALSVYAVGDKSLRFQLDEFYGVTPDIGFIVHLVFSGEYKSRTPQVVPGIPVQARLVERVKNFDEAVERLGEQFYLQPKFDGLRCQIHKGVDYGALDSEGMVWAKHIADAGDKQQGLFDDADVTVKLFSRNLEDMTEMFPEVVAAVKELPDEQFVLDGEVIGWDYATDSYAPFQQTITRKRKHGVHEQMEEVPVKYFIFDVLKSQGQDILNSDLVDRVEACKQYKDDGVMVLADLRLAHDVADIEDYFGDAVEDGLEGLVAKSLIGGYQPGKRNYEWIKLKKSMDSKLVDSLDLVILGYYYGSGTKAEFGMGALLGGVYDSESEKYLSVTKIGTGIPDDLWRTIAKRLEKLTVRDQPDNYIVSDAVAPDVWVREDVVCTIEADEISKSKAHMAARGLYGDPERGLALRFPRMIEFDRDKSPADATSVQELVNMARISGKIDRDIK